MHNWISVGEPQEGFPTIHIISDSLGQTGQAVARAAAASFENVNPAMEIWSEAKDPKKLIADLEYHLEEHRQNFPGKRFIVFYTVVEKETRKALKAFTENNPEVFAVDILDSCVEAIADATGRRPTGRAGAMRTLNDSYFRRIDAIEFTIAHDDGRNPQDLTDADIVLIGVSRSSKTPLSIYLSQLGYKVANIPLDPLTEPPAELFKVDRSRLFGLMTSPDVLVDIRKRRLGNASSVASSYAKLENVYEDLEKSRALMRKLGCIIVHTDNRAIEETSQEILRYYSASHPVTNLAPSSVMSNLK